MGGVETTLLSLIKTLTKYNVEIDLYVLEEGVLSEEFKKITEVNIIPIKIPKNKIIYRILKNLLCSKLYKKYKEELTKKYDIAIAFYGINNYADMFAAASNAKEKFIWVHNNLETQYETSKHKFITKIRNKAISKKFNYFDHIIAVSESSKQGFIKIIKKHASKIIVINNIFDITKLDKQDEKCEYEMLADNKLLYVGRLVNTKCVDILIKEFNKIIKYIPNTELYIIGDGPEREALSKLVISLNLKEKIKFFGNQNNPFKYMKQADVIISASESESYSMSLLEALAMKKYFISANNKGAEDVFYLTNKANIQNGIVCKTEHIHSHVIYYLQNKKNLKQSFDINNYNIEIEKALVNLLSLTKR